MIVRHIKNLENNNLMDDYYFHYEFLVFTIKLSRN